MKAFPAVVKWTGSKRPVAEQLSKYFQEGDTYFEPFVGGGAMMPFSLCQHGVAGDIISELIDLWNKIKDNPLLVADEYQARWQRLQEEGVDVYYEVRDNFNRTRNCYDFLFLTRTCVNGLIRYNENGDFNNSFHLSRPGINPERLRVILQKWSERIQNFRFVNADYREILADAKRGDFVFLDPPYGGTKGRYTKTPFDFDAFFAELDRLNRIGAKWMLTFDGTSGEREYSYAPPDDVFRHKFLIKTGNSSFTKVMNSQTDAIHESVYLNYEPTHDIINLI